MPLDLHLISHALALAKHGNFRRAARELHVSQPTLSRSIAALERSLGVRLFDRTSAGVEPTVFGRLVLGRGRELLAGESDLRREITLQAGLEIGSLAVSAGPYPFEASVARALTRLIQEHPRLFVRATATHARDVVRDDLSGQVDVGVTDRSVAANHERLLFELLPTHQICLACRPGYGHFPVEEQIVFNGRQIHAAPIGPAAIGVYLFTAIAGINNISDSGRSSWSRRICSRSRDNGSFF